MNYKEIIKRIPLLQQRRRWISVGFPRQSVAEHSYNVTALYICLLDKLEPIRKKGKHNELFDYLNHPNQIKKVHLHDIEETYTGDIPKPLMDTIDGNVLFLTNNKIKNKEKEYDRIFTAFFKWCDYSEALSYATTHKDLCGYDESVALEAIQNLKNNIEGQLEIILGYFELDIKGEIQVMLLELYNDYNSKDNKRSSLYFLEQMNKDVL